MNVAMKATGAVISLVNVVLLTRFLGVAGYGTYVYAYAMIGLARSLAEAGAPILLNRETARALNSKDIHGLYGLWGWKDKVLVILGSLAIVLMLGIFWGLPRGEGLEQAFEVILLGLPLVFLLIFTQANAGVLRGLGHANLAFMPQEILRPLFFLLLLSSTFGLGLVETASPAAAVLLLVVAAAAALLVGHCFYIRCRPPKPTEIRSPSRVESWALIKSMGLLGASGVLKYSSTRLTTILVGAFFGPEVVGIFQFSVNIATRKTNPPLLNIILGNATTLLQNRRLRALQRLMWLTAIVTSAMQILVLIIFLLIGETLLVWILPEEFGAAYPLILILMSGGLLFCALGIPSALLIASNNEKYILYAQIIQLAFLIVLFTLLLPPFGLVGAAATVVVVGSISKVFCLWWVWRFTGVDCSILAFLHRPKDKAKRTP